MTRTLTYVYCLVKSARPPSLRGVPRGVPGGGAVRAVPIPPDLSLIVSSVLEDEYNEEAIQRGLQQMDWVGRRAIPHESVVEHFLSSSALLPMQLFTLFTSDERAVESVTSDRRRVARILSRIEGQVEWGLRLTFDEKKAGGAGKAGRAGKARGASYLERKRDLLNVHRVQLNEARGAAGRLYRALGRKATRSQRRTATERAAPGSRLLLDAAFLVPARNATSFRAELRRQARALARSGVSASLTGPWPPYNFI